MKEPLSKREQLKSAQKRQVWLKYKVGVLSRSLNRLLLLAEKPRDDFNGFKGLSYMAIPTLMSLQSKLGKTQREVHSNRAKIIRLENEIALAPRKRTVTFDCWVAMLYDLFAIRGAEVLIAGDKEHYREDYNSGLKITDVVDKEIALSPNLMVNGRRIT